MKRFKPCYLQGDPLAKTRPNPKMQVWIDARKRHSLTHAQIQMARELGLNPAKIGKIDNHLIGDKT